MALALGLAAAKWLRLSGFAWLWLVAWLPLGCFSLALALDRLGFGYCLGCGEVALARLGLARLWLSGLAWLWLLAMDEWFWLGLALAK